MKRTYSFLASTGALLISITALVFSVSYLELNKLNFSAEALLTVSGILITALAFVLGAYFAFLAVKAFEDIRSVEKQVVKIEKLGQKAIKANKSINSILQSHLNDFVITIEYQMSLLDNLSGSVQTTDKKLFDNLLKRKEELFLMRARMCYKFPYLEMTLRQKFLLELSQHGTEEDLPYLRQVLDSSNENKDFKEIVRTAIQEIEKNLGK